ncbi:Quino amine dehydrogenase beta chain protein [Rutstroemia sp. NJR-2017a BVV2]|nr:Quino amine dehydrogenase beta chain protein [Rutstroemia sp. NJR-2017a BVV2]
MKHIDGIAALLPYDIIARMEVGTFLENLAVRSNGTLLVSNMISGEIIYVDPRHSNPQSTVKVIHDFNSRSDFTFNNKNERNGGYGSKYQAEAIVEDLNTPDIFYTFSGLHGTAGTWAMYRIDMRQFDSSPSGEHELSVTKVVDIPGVVWLNGATMIPQTSTVLVAESVQGKLIACDVLTGEVSVWLQDNELGKATDRPPWPAINGVQYFRKHVFATISDRATLVHMGVDDKGQYEKGSLRIVAENLTGDDLALDVQGNAYIATNVAHTVLKFPSIGVDLEKTQEDGRVRIMGGLDKKDTAGPTAVAFGRGVEDQNCIYVTTNGGLINPIGNEGPGEAVIVRIDIGVKGEAC